MPLSNSTQSRPRLGATLLLACLAQFMVILDVSVVNVALPSIHGALHFSEQDLQWVVNAYTVTFAGFLLLGGRAADLLGRRRVFVGGLLLFGAASLAGGLAQTQFELIAARAIQGLGGAVIAPASLSILTTTFPEGAARNRAVGIWGAMGGAGGAAGVLLGGILTQYLGWRWILFINLPIAIGAAVGSARVIAEGRNRDSARSFDLPGALAATVGLSLLVLGIVRTDVTGWGSAQALGLIGGGVALLAAFVAIESRLASQPLMPLRIYRSRTLSASNLVVLLIGAATFSMWFFLSLYLQQVRGYSAIRAGLAFLPMTLCIVAGSTVASRMVARVGTKPLLVTRPARSGHRPGLVLPALADGQLCRPGARALAARGDRDRDLLRPGDHLGRGRGGARGGRSRLRPRQHLAAVRRRARPGRARRAGHRAHQPRARARRGLDRAHPHRADERL